MKQKIKILGIVATLLLLITGISPAVLADVPDPRQNPTDIEMIFINNWNETNAICAYWDEYGVETDLPEELEEDLDDITRSIDAEITDLEQQSSGITYFFRVFCLLKNFFQTL